MNYRCILLLTVMLVGFGSAAQRPGATFLLIPPGAKATGMAYAYTAVCDDASANYYNAAGLAFLEAPIATAQYCGYLPRLNSDMHHVYVGAAYPLSKSAWGFDFIYFSPGTTDLYDENGIYLGEYRIWRIAAKINHARKMGERFAFAIGGKFINQKYTYGWWWHWIGWPPYQHGIDPGGTGCCWAFDFNVLYKILPNLSLGTVFHNIGPNIHYTDDGPSDPLPWTYRLGIAYKPIDNEYIALTMSNELTKVLVGMFFQEEKSFWENLTYEFKAAWKGVGLELTFYRILSLRGGYFYDREGVREGFTFGGGISVKNFELDIGIDENIFDFPTQNRKISLSYTL